MIKKCLKIFLREQRKFCNTFCGDFFTFFDEYPTLINILMLVVIVKWQIYIRKKYHFQMLSCRHCLKMKMKIVNHKSVCRHSARNRILPSYPSVHGATSFYFANFASLDFSLLLHVWPCARLITENFLKVDYQLKRAKAGLVSKRTAFSGFSLMTFTMKRQGMVLENGVS